MFIFKYVESVYCYFKQVKCWKRKIIIIISSSSLCQNNQLQNDTLEGTPVYIPPLTYIVNKKNHKKSKWIFWITRQLFPIILVQGPHSDPLWNKHCMSNKKIISCSISGQNNSIYSIQKILPHRVVIWHPCFYMWLYFNKWRVFLQLKPNQIR